MHLVVDRGYQEVAQLVLANEPDINARDDNGALADTNPTVLANDSLMGVINRRKPQKSPDLLINSKTNDRVRFESSPIRFGLRSSFLTALSG